MPFSSGFNWGTLWGSAIVTVAVSLTDGVAGVLCAQVFAAIALGVLLHKLVSWKRS